MKKVAIVTDSNSGITQKQAQELGIIVIAMPFMFDDSEDVFFEDINLTREEFFKRLEMGQSVHTSQPSPGEVTDTWDKLLEEYEEIVHIPMSSGLSGACQSAYMLAQDYDGKVQVVNNQRISVTQKRAVMDAIALADKGWNAEMIRTKLEEEKMQSSIYIMLDTLSYLKKGGRITPAAAAIGSLLRIKPVLQIKGERLDAFSKARTTQQGKTTMINQMRKDINELYGGPENVYLYAVHANCPEQFAAWEKEMKEAFPDVEIESDALSLSVSCHIGPGALAIACSKKITETQN